ncbi:hypothetical protein L1987_89085 [Smallanthus sonchifolius]|nr:hypothetical protein L1987_89085 [Smallanthus sonchifolius]
MFVLQSLGCSRSWTSCSSDPEWILVEGQSKALQAFESKHGHLQLRGSSRSSMEEPYVPEIGDRLIGKLGQEEQVFPFHWFLKALNPRFSHIDSPSRIGSASDNEPMRKLSLLLWANRPTELGWASMSQNLSLAKNPIIDRIEADPIHWQMKNLPFSHSEKPRKEEESLRQELGKQARRRG